MAEELGVVPISFVSVLAKVCACLGYEEPHYYPTDFGRHISQVIVSLPDSPYALTYIGDAGENMTESSESAARRMAIYLVEQKKIVVHDINLETRVSHEHASQLYGMKKDVLDRVENCLAAVEIYDIDPVEGVDWGMKTVRISFLELLAVVVDKMKVPVTPLEIIELEKELFIAWIGIAVPSEHCVMRCVVGDRMPNATAAKECIAKKAIEFMMAKYHFEIEDINYHFLYPSAVEFSKERLRYIEVKENVCGAVEEKEPRAVLVKEKMVDLRSLKTEPPAAREPPTQVADAHNHGQSSRSFGFGIASNFIPPDLIVVSERLKRGP